MPRKIPKPRKPSKQLKCPWCGKEFMTLQGLQDHANSCPKNPNG